MKINLFNFESYWSKEELKIFKGLNSPYKIQLFLDSLKYSDEYIYRSPKSVMRDRKAHCFDGGIFAAAALRRLGYPPVIIDMIADRDDDHVITIYKKDGYFGSIAKSNFSGLRFREPIYKNYRELVLSYFDAYYNLNKEKTLRGYIIPLGLSRFDKYNWMSDDKGMDEIEKVLNTRKVVKIFTRKMIKNFSPVDERTYQSGLMGANMNGLYKP